MPQAFKGRRVVHFIDNESALAAAIKGYSGQLDSVRIVNLFHIVRLRLGCNVWFYYVPSESNISDWPSRGRLRDVLSNAEIGARAVRMQLPALRLLTGPWRDVFDDVSGMLMHV